MADTEKHCRDCLGLMPSDASKCRSCGSFQNWRRHFTFTTTVVSFFLAGVATAGIILEPVKEFITPVTDIRLERVGSTAKGYSVLIANKGRATAVIKYVHIFYGERIVELQGSIEDPLIKSGETRYLTVTWPEDEPQPSRFELNFDRKEVDGETRQRCEVMFAIFAKEEVWKTIDERPQNGGDCLGDIGDFLGGVQASG